MKSQELRESFLKYFEKNGHKRLASSSLVPANDPTLFFTNAGMVQFKDVFLGAEKRDCKRAATSQKCMRVSGKHNDLENVGHTPRHHTFFEMLGNFSFGDYFKKEAIAYGWEYLTKELALPVDRLYVTIFEDDDEAEKLWLKHVSKDRIFRMGEKDNFWSMADIGPCGPCSEIHFDMKPAGSVVASDFESDRFMEIWNLVFMQYSRGQGGKLTPLAKPSIDTGMGLERLAAVVIGANGNYETDLFMPVIKQLERICGHKYGSDYSSKAVSDVSMRVVADHIRSMVFLIGDGVQPSNEGRGYVLRRIIRRAARHGKLLKIEGQFFVPLAHMVIDMMGMSYPEIVQHKSFIEKVVSNEEGRFSETLQKGLEILDQKFRELSAKGSKILPGEDVFALYDTYGFPKDLTEDIAADAGFAIDSLGFEKNMTGQRERARSAWKGSGEEAVADVFKKLNKEGVTSIFSGYDKLSANSSVVAIIKDGVQIKSAKANDEIAFIAGETPFYGESGGQVGDTGMAVGEGLEVTILDARKPLSNMTVHYGVVKSGELKIGSKITLAVDAERRSDTTRNHTATHILHRALRETLGEHVKQAGSSVGPDRLRFDFSHFEALTVEQISEIEADANRIIRMNLPVKIEELSFKEAVKRGALAFFGDKYGDTVRTITIGDYSCELCGGTHVKRSGDIGMIKILSESSVAAGVRRVEAITGKGVEAYLREMDVERNKLAVLLKSSCEEVSGRVEKLVQENKKLQRELENVRVQLYSGKSADVDLDIKKVGDINYFAKLIEGVCPKELRTLADNLKNKIGSGVVLLVCESDEKTSLLVAVTKDLVGKYSAGSLVKEMVADLGGTGGGRPDMAQGGLHETGKFDLLNEKMREILKMKL